MRADTSVRMPTYFLSHGGGPWPWLAGPMRDNMAELEKSLQRLPHELPAAPTAILMISGHWEAPTFTVQACAMRCSTPKASSATTAAVMGEARTCSWTTSSLTRKVARPRL